MIHIKRVRIETDEIVAITCDICGFKYEDQCELQAFTHINETGSWGSIFGDGNNIRCDICQHCLQEKLGKFLNISPAQIKT